jgi:hypothetical protein
MAIVHYSSLECLKTPVRSSSVTGFQAVIARDSTDLILRAYRTQEARSERGAGRSA